MKQLKVSNKTLPCTGRWTKVANARVKFEGQLLSRTWSQKLPILDGFEQFLSIIVKVFGTKGNTDNQKMVFKTTQCAYTFWQFPWTLVHKRLKIGASFLPTLYICTLFSCLLSRAELKRWNSAKLRDMFGNEADLQVHMQTLGVHSA